ncbi:penicillin acylase family protein [Sphingomonas sp. MMS24-JH45]
MDQHRQSPLDLVDVYRLTLDPAGERYRWGRDWRPLEPRRVWLSVKLWGPFVLPVPRMVLRAVQGPVMATPRGTFAIRMLGRISWEWSRNVARRLNRARDFAEWQRALARQKVPGTNFIYADAAGHIAHFYNASFPAAAPASTIVTFYPVTILEPSRRNGRLGRGAAQRRSGSGFVIDANNTPYQAAGTGL